MRPVRENRDMVRQHLQERLHGRGVPSGLGTFTGVDRYAAVRDLNVSEIKQLCLISDENCPGCHEAMEEFIADIDNGTLQVVAITSDKGLDIVEALGVAAVPSLVVELQDGTYLEFRES